MHRLVLFEAVAGAIAVIGGVAAWAATRRDQRLPPAPDENAYFHHVVVADSEDDRRAAKLANQIAGVQWFEEGEDPAVAEPVARAGRSRRLSWPARRDAAARAVRAASARRRSARRP